MYRNTTARMADSDVSFTVTGGTRQGGIDSPPAFIYYLDFVLKIVAEEINKEFPEGVGIEYEYEVIFWGLKEAVPAAKSYQVPS